MTPTSPLSPTTGRWRIRFPVIMAAHSSRGVSGPQAVTGAVMTSATLVAAGSRRCATTRRRMSRSVKIPASRFPSVTTRPPIPRSFMRSAACSTVSPGATEMMSLPFLARMFWTVAILPPPALEWSSSILSLRGRARHLTAGPPRDMPMPPLVLLALTLAAVQQKQDSQPPPPPSTIPELESRIRSVLARTHTPAAGIALVTRDSVLWVAGIGKADVASGRDATAETLFRIGSTSKAFGSLLVLMLQQEGKLRLDDPVRRHAP